jgi:hypothetical protein
MMKMAALGVAIDPGHLSLSTGSSKVVWNNHCHHPYPRLSRVIFSDIAAVQGTRPILRTPPQDYNSRDSVLYGLSQRVILIPVHKLQVRIHFHVDMSCFFAACRVSYFLSDVILLLCR